MITQRNEKNDNMMVAKCRPLSHLCVISSAKCEINRLMRPKIIEETPKKQVRMHKPCLGLKMVKKV